MRPRPDPHRRRPHKPRDGEWASSGADALFWPRCSSRGAWALTTAWAARGCPTLSSSARRRPAQPFSGRRWRRTLACSPRAMAKASRRRCTFSMASRRAANRPRSRTPVRHGVKSGGPSSTCRATQVLTRCELRTRARFRRARRACYYSTTHPGRARASRGPERRLLTLRLRRFQLLLDTRGGDSAHDRACAPAHHAFHLAAARPRRAPRKPLVRATRARAPSHPRALEFGRSHAFRCEGSC